MTYRTDVAGIIEEVKRNIETLRTCPGPHEFVEVPEIENVPGAVPGTKRVTVVTRRWRCAECLGEVDHHAMHWYTLGLQHGKL